MTEHLRPEELIDALDDALGASRRAHLAACADCQDEVASLRAMLHEVEGRGHAGAVAAVLGSLQRARAAGDGAKRCPRAQPWWQRVVAAGRRWSRRRRARWPWSSCCGRLASRPVGVGAGGRPAAAVDALADDGSWGLVIGLASELDAADVREAAKPADGTADAMIEELTAGAAQRARAAARGRNRGAVMTIRTQRAWCVRRGGRRDAVASSAAFAQTPTPPPTPGQQGQAGRGPRGGGRAALPPITAEHEPAAVAGLHGCLRARAGRARAVS